MITREVFFKQRDKKRAEFKKQKLEVYPDYDVFYYLVKEKPNSFGCKCVELKKFNWGTSGYEDRKFYLKYNLSKYKEKGLNKLYPVLEEIKFKEIIIDLPVGGIDECHNLEHVLTPSGIVFEKVSDTSKKVETIIGVYPKVKKFKLFIPEKYFKDGKRK